MSEQTVELEIKDLSGKLVTLRPDGQGVIHLPLGTYESDTGVIIYCASREVRSSGT
jgi:hypothetical protein